MTNIGGMNPVAYSNTFNKPATPPKFQGGNKIIESKPVETTASGNFIFMGLEFLAAAIALGAAVYYGAPKLIQAIKNFAGESGLWKTVSEKSASVLSRIKEALASGKATVVDGAKEATEATTTASKTAKKAASKASASAKKSAPKAQAKATKAGKGAKE